MTGAQLQGAIVETAQLRGWHVAHFRPARTARGWRTPVEGHAGFVDLVLARRGVVFMWEVKGDGDDPSIEQLEWLAAIGAGVADCRIVEPADLDDALLALELGRWPAI